MNPSEPEPLPERLRRLREERGLSQRGLARVSGLTAQAISLIESGQRPNMKIKTVEKLAEALGIRPAEVVGW